MNQIPQSKDKFEKLSFFQKSKVKEELVKKHFSHLCQHLTTADLPSFASVLHRDDLDELQKRARVCGESSVIADFLLKLMRSCKSHEPWWTVLEKVMHDKGNHILYTLLNPWDDDGDSVAAERGGQPSVSHQAKPSALSPSSGGGPQTPYPASTPLGNTRGLVNLLKPLCDGQKWRTLANYLDLTMKEQLQIKAQDDEKHIHLVDAVISKFGDSATVGTLTRALSQLGTEGESILRTMEDQLIIQPVPKEESEAGDGATFSFQNPFEIEQIGVISTVTQQPPPYYPSPYYPIPRVFCSKGNVQPPSLDVSTPRPVNMANQSPAYCSLDSHTGTSKRNILPDNNNRAFSDGQDPVHTGYPPQSAAHVLNGSREVASVGPDLQVDSPVESLRSQQHPDGEESDVNTISPTGSQYPGVALPYAPHWSYEHRFQNQHQDLSFEPSAVTPGGADHSPDSYHQTFAKQLRTSQAGEENDEHQNSLVEDCGASMDSFRFPYNVAQDSEDDMFRLDDPRGEGPVSQYPTHQSHDADVDLRMLPIEGLNITERESLASTETAPNNVQRETEALPAGERQQDQQRQQQPVRINFFQRLFRNVKESFETLE